MLINLKLANLEVVTQFGKAKFDENGVTNDLTPEEQAALGKAPGFEYKEDKKPAAKPKEEVKAEVQPAPKGKAKKE